MKSRFIIIQCKVQFLEIFFKSLFSKAQFQISCRWNLNLIGIFSRLLAETWPHDLKTLSKFHGSFIYYLFLDYLSAFSVTNFSWK